MLGAALEAELEQSREGLDLDLDLDFTVDEDGHNGIAVTIADLGILSKGDQSNLEQDLEMDLELDLEHDLDSDDSIRVSSSSLEKNGNRVSMKPEIDSQTESPDSRPMTPERGPAVSVCMGPPDSQAAR